MEERELVVSGAAGLGAAVAAESGTELGELEAIHARGYWELVWSRFKRDRIAVASGVFVILLILVAFVGAPIARHFLGHGPNYLFIGSNAVSDQLQPAGPWTWVDYQGKYGQTHHTLLVLGASNTLGQDEFLRLLYGAQVSLEVALLSTIGVMFVGVLMGSIAGYYRGWVDSIVSKVTEVTMAFPALLFVIALAATVGPRLDSMTLGGIFDRGVLTLTFIFTLFGWFYPARIMRAQVLSIREKEFVEAARMVGADDGRIIRSHVLPHLAAPIIVYSSLIVAHFVLAEAGLSFLGLGIRPPDASWGNLLADSTQYYLARPWLVVWPGLAVLSATLAFNLLGDGLRDAFDPRSQLVSM